jgi:Ankyrin repeat.
MTMNDDKSLLYACYINDVKLVKERIENVNPTQLKKSTIEMGTPLHAAAVNENKEIVDLLLGVGVNIETGNLKYKMEYLYQFDSDKYKTCKACECD